MHELPLLINIAVALVLAFVGGVIASRIGFPTIVGYMLAGIAIGPFTPGFVGDVDTVSQLAELGVIFLMFGVGLHFSLSDLWKVRDIAIPGALGQTIIATVLGYWLTQTWGWSKPAGLVLGLAISVASTVVLIRGLMDNGLLNTPHGQAAIGWLVFEDLATIFILILMPGMAAETGGIDWVTLGLTLLKAAVFVGILLFVGKKLIPWILLGVARTGSRELFILAVLAISLGTALGAAELFGVSLALGAFVAGVVVGESPLSHQVSADLLPFREAFSVLFFVSIGMLVNLRYLASNIGSVLALTALIVLGKYVLTVLLGFLIRRPARTFLVVAAGLSQIGEFSFILGQSGLSLGLLNQDQYSLILAGALLSITVNPLMFRSVSLVEKWLKKFPTIWKWMDRHGPARAPVVEPLSNHVVVIGYGRVGQHIVNVLGQLNVPRLVIDSDALRIEELDARGMPTLYGDAGNSEVLAHAGLRRACLLVVTIPEEATTGVIVAAARDEAPHLPIIARAATDAGVRSLASLGAQQVIHPELEGGLQIVRRTLLQLGFPISKVQEYADAVRGDYYDSSINTEQERQLLQDLLSASDNIGLTWLRLETGNPLVGRSLAEANLRTTTGASVVAIMRDRELITNPEPGAVLQADDLMGLVGNEEQLNEAQKVLVTSGGGGGVK
ncbi:MAG: cation:proton antiporter [Blastocatellales bacterium]